VSARVYVYAVILPCVVLARVLPRYLLEHYGLDAADVGPKRLWGFGPDGKGPNWLLDATRGVNYLHEIQGAVCSGFQWACREGPLCSEPVCFFTSITSSFTRERSVPKDALGLGPHKSTQCPDV
jgi:translation elongation factor EF-G